jgi:hypothetical protein
VQFLNNLEKCLLHNSCAIVVQETRDIEWIPRGTHVVEPTTWDPLMSLESCTTVAQLSRFSVIFYKENVRFTTPIQQLYNNPSHEGEPHYVGATLM